MQLSEEKAVSQKAPQKTSQIQYIQRIAELRKRSDESTQAHIVEIIEIGKIVFSKFNNLAVKMQTFEEFVNQPTPENGGPLENKTEMTYRTSVDESLTRLELAVRDNNRSLAHLIELLNEYIIETFDEI